MGLVAKANAGMMGMSFMEEPAAEIPDALIGIGKERVTVKLAALKPAETKAIILRADALSRFNRDIAEMVAEEIPNLINAIRWVKTETKQEFAGALATGSQLTFTWLRPKHVGDTTLMNKATTSGKGLYGGTNASVLTWLQAFTADTSDDIIPSQQMLEEAGMIHIGICDPVDVPKCDAIRFTLAGIAGPAEPLPFNLREAYGTTRLPVAKFEKPVIVGPEQLQAIDLEPNLTGDSKPQLLSFLIAEARLIVL